jgi:hypothetical protein
MRNLPTGHWIANAAAGLTGSYRAITRQAQQTGCSRQSVHDHTFKVVAAVEAQRGGGPTREELIKENETLRREKRPAMGVAVPGHRVSSAQATEVHHRGPRSLPEHLGFWNRRKRSICTGPIDLGTLLVRLDSTALMDHHASSPLSYVSHQFTTQYRHRLADQDHARACHPNLNDSSPARYLMGDERGTIELLGPVGPEAAMCGPADRVFIDAHLRREEARNEVIIPGARTAGNDHASDRELFQASDIRAKFSYELLRLELDQQVKAVAAGEPDGSTEV